MSRLAWGRQDGQTMAEYGVILAVVAVGVVVALSLLSNGVGSALNAVTSYL